MKHLVWGTFGAKTTQFSKGFNEQSVIIANYNTDLLILIAKAAKSTQYKDLIMLIFSDIFAIYQKCHFYDL